ncbi:unnamed protein product [Caenorhabditis angaria]|uniref:Uncharacterized protein n=1 Tax=Caenorhabditis angaria TaxID=860376 RepID=A0A9P1MV07_9PELO|nr:unnamed protein product [Caenorhabditis angaria]
MMASVEDEINNVSECSVYSIQPSETNVTMHDGLDDDDIPPNTDPSDMIARNASEMIITFADATQSEKTAHDMSVYSVPKSETNVTLSNPSDYSNYTNMKSETNVTLRDAFSPCHDLRELNMSIYTTPASETHVTIPQKTEYSEYTVPKSETNVTMNKTSAVSQYTIPVSEVGVTMADGFVPCDVLRKMQDGNYPDEVSAVNGCFDEQELIFEKIQQNLDISDERIFGIEKSDGSIAKCVDSIECLVKLNDYQPIPLDFEFSSSVNFNCNLMQGPESVESYLLKTGSSSYAHHEI